MTTQTKILIVDDHAIARRGLEAILIGKPSYKVIGYANSVTEAITKTKALQPDLLLLDNFLPDGNASQVIENLKRENCPTRILIVSGEKSDKTLFEAFMAGADGYVWKYAEESEISQAIDIVSQGNSFFMADFVDHIRQSTQPNENRTSLLKNVFEQLNERDIAIIQLVGAGQTNSEIAENLALAEGTVRNYLSAILLKTGASNRMQLAIWAIQYGIAPTPRLE